MSTPSLHEAVAKSVRTKKGGPIDAMEVVLFDKRGKRLSIQMPLASAYALALAIGQCGADIKNGESTDEGGLPS